MTTSGLVVHVINQRTLPIIAGLAVAFFAATAQAQSAEPKSSPQARVIVVGEGSLTVTPDYASSGATTATLQRLQKPPIEVGENTITASVTVGFGIAE